MIWNSKPTLVDRFPPGEATTGSCPLALSMRSIPSFAAKVPYRGTRAPFPDSFRFLTEVDRRIFE